MRILEISLDGMGCFSVDGVSFDLDADRVVVLGPNEAGKSTLMRSISALLFGFDSSSEESRWIPWQPHDKFGGRIVFEVSGIRYELSRQWGGDKVQLAGDDKILFEDEINPRGKTGEPFRDVLSGILPLPSSELFDMLSFIRQEELAEEITEDLRQRITGGQRQDALTVREHIEEKYSDLTWEKPPWGARRLSKPRIIEDIEKELSDKRQRRRNAQEATQKCGNVERELQAVEATLAIKEKEALAIKQLLGNLDELSNRLEKENRVRENSRHISEERERVEELDNKARSLEETIQKEFAVFKDLPLNTDEQLHLLSIREQNKADLDQKISLETENLRLLQEKAKSRWYQLAIAAAAGLIIGGLVGMKLEQTLIGGLAGVIIGFLGGYIGQRIQYYRQKKEWQKEESDIERLCGDKEDISKELDKVRAELSPILNQYSSAQALKRWKAFQNMNRDLRDAQKGVEGNRPLDKIKSEDRDTEEEYRRIADQIEEIVKKNPYLSPFRKNLGDLMLEAERRRGELKEMDEEIESLEKQQDSLRLEWNSQQAGGIDDVETLDGEIQGLESQLIDYRRQKDALMLAHECLVYAIDNFKDEHSGDIQLRLDELFKSWTGDVSRSVVLDDEWSPLIAHPRNPKILPELLSRGTYDQLYLAYRVALSEAISKETPLPFLLDDPFVHFDPERRKLAREAFEAISETHQVILFTQDPGFSDWGKVVEL